MILPVRTVTLPERRAGARGGPAQTEIAQEVLQRQKGWLQTAPLCSRNPRTHVAHLLVQAVTLEFHYRLIFIYQDYCKELGLLKYQ